MTTLELKQLLIGYTHDRNKKPVMGYINATLQSGELVALIGANGAGKTTLLRTLSAFQEPLDGNIIYPDGSCCRRSAADLATQLAVVLTNNNNIFNLTVREIVALGRVPYTNFLGYKSSHDEEVIDYSMELVKISHLAERRVDMLSDGERQKVMIAKALAQETPVIMLDEPTAFLDFKSRVQLFRMLKRLASENNKTVLVSTHDLELVLQLTDRIWLIHNGSLHTGTVRELAMSGVLSEFIESDGIKYDVVNNRIEVK